MLVMPRIVHRDFDSATPTPKSDVAPPHNARPRSSTTAAACWIVSERLRSGVATVKTSGGVCANALPRAEKPSESVSPPDRTTCSTRISPLGGCPSLRVEENGEAHHPRENDSLPGFPGSDPACDYLLTMRKNARNVFRLRPRHTFDVTCPKIDHAPVGCCRRYHRRRHLDARSSARRAGAVLVCHSAGQDDAGQPAAGRAVDCGLDVGSKTVKLSVVSMVRGQNATIRDERQCKRTLGMGALVFDSTSQTARPLPDESIGYLRETVNEYQRICALDGGAIVAAGATQWARDATNIGDVLRKVKAQTGVAIEVLSAAQEAEYRMSPRRRARPVASCSILAATASSWPGRRRGTGVVRSILVPYGYVRGAVNDIEPASDYAAGRAVYQAKAKLQIESELAKLTPPMSLVQFAIPCDERRHRPRHDRTRTGRRRATVGAWIAAPRRSHLDRGCGRVRCRPRQAATWPGSFIRHRDRRAAQSSRAHGLLWRRHAPRTSRRSRRNRSGRSTDRRPWSSPRSSICCCANWAPLGSSWSRKRSRRDIFW